MSASPPPVDGDEKDWTWVLERPCDQCGFDASMVRPGDVASMLRNNTSAWVLLLSGDEGALRTRPSDNIWSPLEYACHVRDVHDLYRERLELMLNEDGPNYANWNQDVTAVESRYDLADPVEVSRQLVVAAESLADLFDTVTGEQWERTGFRSDGAAFTIASFATYFIHDPIHHLFDVRLRGLRASDRLRALATRPSATARRA